MKPLVPCTLLLCASASPVLAQASLRERVHAVLAEKGSFRDAITVDGRPVDQLEVMRTLIYRNGKQVLEGRIVSLAVEAEVRRRKQAGDETSYEISDERIDREIQRAIAGSGGDEASYWKAAAKKQLTKESIRKHIAADLLFAKLFLDGAPKDWPEFTKDAIRAMPDGERFLQNLLRQNAPPELFGQMVKQWVVKHIKKTAKVRYATDGLPPEHCLEVNGQPWKTRSALREIGDYDREERVTALLQVALDMAVEKDLAAKNALLEPAEIDKAYAEYAGSLKPPFTVEVLALSFKGYPSYPLFRKRWGYRQCFERMIEKEITDAELAAHAEKRSAFLVGAKVGVDLIRIPPGTDEIATTLMHARAIRAAIDSGKQSFEQAMNKHCVWADKPPTQGLAYNQLRTILGESEYRDYLGVESRADELFFSAKRDAVVGPFAAADAVFLAQVHDPTRPMPLDLTAAETKKVVRQDYVQQRFVAWVRELARRVEVR